MCFSSLFYSFRFVFPIFFLGVSSAFLEQRTKDGYNTFDDTSTIFPSSHNSIINPKWNEPNFDTTVPNNVTALVGKSAYLSCKVRNLGNKTVSIINGNVCSWHITYSNKMCGVSEFARNESFSFFYSYYWMSEWKKV